MSLDSFFDWKYYVSIHADLKHSKINTKRKALKHYISHGCKEGRLCNPFDVPLFLKQRISRTKDVTNYMAVGKIYYIDILKIVDKYLSIGKDVQILEWGVGCGRVIQHFLLNNDIELVNLYGVDADEEAVRFIRKIYPPEVNLMVCEFDVQLPIYKGFFDFIYAVLILTCIEEQNVIKWLMEIFRLLKKDGIFVITMHGENYREEGTMSRFKNVGGFDYYGCSYKHSNIIMDKIKNTPFIVLDYIPAGVNGNQDVIILQKEGSNRIRKTSHSHETEPTSAHLNKVGKTSHSHETEPNSTHSNKVRKISHLHETEPNSAHSKDV